MYGSTLPSTSALDVGEWSSQRHAPAALPPGKTRYPLCRRLGGPQGRSGPVRKILPPTGIRSPGHPSRNESLYRLSYPGPQNLLRAENIFFFIQNVNLSDHFAARVPLLPSPATSVLGNRGLKMVKRRSLPS